MARENGATADPLELLEGLRDEPYRFDFYEALRRLECAYPDRPRWGESRHAQEDPLRLGQEPSLAFAPSQVASFDSGGGVRPARLRIFHPGLFGPNGPLPLHLTEFARERQFTEGDYTFARFADIFHHRMLALLYRSWSGAQPAVQYDRPEADRIALVLGALIGMGSPTLRRRGSWLDRVLLYHAGALAAPTRHAEGLCGLLGDFFGAEARVESFVGHWIDLPPEEQCRLGSSAAASLGKTTTVGRQVWDRQHKFRIILGPLGFDSYCGLLPDGRHLPRLVTMVRSYVGDDLFWDVNIVLRKEEVRPLKLDGTASLGRTTWLQSKPAERDCGELILDPAAYAA